MTIQWIRTLEDEKADLAISILEQVIEIIALQQIISPAAYGRSTVIEVNGEAPWTAKITLDFEKGWMSLEADGCLSSSSHHLIRFADTPSAGITSDLEISSRDLLEKLELWLAGLRGPFHQKLPIAYDLAFDEFMTFIATAAHLDEPEWDWLMVELGVYPKGPLVVLVTFDDIIEITPDAKSPARELHPELAKHLLKLMSNFIEVRECEFLGPDLRILFGEPAIRFAYRLDGVELLRAFSRIPKGFGLPNGFRLYAET